MDRLEHNLAFLATVSNTSPYIGLLGTVWGIMSSFQALGGDAERDDLRRRAVHLGSARRDGHGPHRRDSRPASSSTATRIRSAASRCVTTRSWKSCRRSSSATPRGATRGARRRTRQRRPGGARDMNTNEGQTAPDVRDQRRAVHRRDARAADHLHDHGAAADARHQRRLAERAGGAARPRALEGQRAAGAQRRSRRQVLLEHRRRRRSSRSTTRPSSSARRPCCGATRKRRCSCKADETVPYGRVVTRRRAAAAGGRHQDRFPDGSRWRRARAGGR